MGANQATSAGGSIIIRADNLNVSASDGLPLKPGEYVRIRVIDRGRGIPEDILPHIFDPYFTTKELGSGLGLASAYSIVKNHGGAIGVSSKVGKGTTFSVYLPASHREPEHTPNLEDSPVMGAGRILVMDDEKVVQELTSDYLGGDSPSRG